MSTGTKIILIFTLITCIVCFNGDGFTLYYYGLEESERGLPACSARQACSALVQRYWRKQALVRLCRCARRRTCAAVEHNYTLPMNNRAQFYFCQPIETCPECRYGTKQISAVTVQDNELNLNPDTIEDLHHQNTQLTPPRLTFTCRCHPPLHWRLVEDDGRTQQYKCDPLPQCRSGEFCGNVSYDLNALYQSCLCPNNHICVQNGGLDYVNITEILYRGKGMKAYCQKINDTESYEDY